MNPANDPQCATKQIGRVYTAIKDGGWHKLTDIAAATGDPKKSVSSRIRDLRLATNGAHQIEARVVNKTTQNWEYRLKGGDKKPHKGISGVSTPKFRGVIGVTGIQGHYPVNPVAKAGHPAPANNKQVKFLNTKTRQIERISGNKCRVEPLGAFQRVVALDGQGNIIKHLVTTQDLLPL